MSKLAYCIRVNRMHLYYCKLSAQILLGVGFSSMPVKMGPSTLGDMSKIEKSAEEPERRRRRKKPRSLTRFVFIVVNTNISSLSKLLSTENEIYFQ